MILVGPIQLKIFYATLLLFYSILFYSILFYSILFYSILFYSILFCSVLFCSVLSCPVLYMFSTTQNRCLKTSNQIIVLYNEVTSFTYVFLFQKIKKNYSFIPQSVWRLVIALSLVQGLALGLVELHEVCMIKLIVWCHLKTC